MDLALQTSRGAKAALAPRRAKIQDDQKALLSAFEESKKSLVQAQLDRKKMEAESEAKDQVVRKHTGELNSVKSNDAYKALLTEIENAKREKAVIEDKTLELMEAQDRLQKELSAREKTLDADKAELARKAAAVDAEEKAADEAIAARSAERDAFAATLPADAVRRYDAVRRGRAEAEVKDMICQGCRRRLTADVVNSVMKAKDVVNCESCSRILYIRPAPAAAAAS
jgi:predicted  nucleic acid-binding Zn-ribbon protein